MKDCNSLPPKQQFIRTLIVVLIMWALLAGVWIFFAHRYVLSAGWIIKFLVCALIVAVVSIMQLGSAYAAWNRDEQEH